MPSLSPENVLLSLLVVAPGFIAVYTSIILGGVEESLSDGRILGASIAVTFLVDTLFFWIYTIFIGEISTPTDAVSLFFRNGFRPWLILLLVIISIVVGVIGAIVIAADSGYLLREKVIQKYFDIYSHPHQPWEGALREAEVIRVFTPDEWYQGFLYEWSKSGKERQLSIADPARWEKKDSAWESMDLDQLLLFEDKIEQVEIVTTVRLPNSGEDRAE